MTVQDHLSNRYSGKWTSFATTIDSAVNNLGLNLNQNDWNFDMDHFRTQPFVASVEMPSIVDLILSEQQGKAERETSFEYNNER